MTQAIWIYLFSCWLVGVIGAAGLAGASIIDGSKIFKAFSREAGVVVVVLLAIIAPAIALGIICWGLWRSPRPLLEVFRFLGRGVRDVKQQLLPGDKIPKARVIK